VSTKVDTVSGRTGQLGSNVALRGALHRQGAPVGVVVAAIVGHETLELRGDQRAY
jgi:hypothetical protein